MEIKNFNYNQQNFCALKRDPSVLYYLKRFSEPTRAKVDLLEIYNANVPVDTHITTRKIFGRERIVATVGEKTFIESVFRGPVETIKKGLNYALERANKQNIQK